MAVSGPCGTIYMASGEGGTFYLEGGIFDLYEIVPGFLLASIAIVVITKMSPEKKQDVIAQFDKVESIRSSL